MYVEGLVHITELGGEYFRFDEARQELRGERTGIRYAIGTRVQVQVSRVDLDGRKIDFRLVQEGDELRSLTARAMKDKAGGAELPVQERGVERKRGAKTASKAVTKRSEPASGGRGAGSASRRSSTGRSVDAQSVSPIEALKAAVKKSVSNPGRKQGKKPRR